MMGAGNVLVLLCTRYGAPRPANHGRHAGARGPPPSIGMNETHLPRHAPAPSPGHFLAGLRARNRKVSDWNGVTTGETLFFQPGESVHRNSGSFALGISRSTAVSPWVIPRCPRHVRGPILSPSATLKKLRVITQKPLGLFWRAATPLRPIALRLMRCEGQVLMRAGDVLCVREGWGFEWCVWAASQ